MKFAIITAIHGRADLTAIVLRHYQRIIRPAIEVRGHKVLLKCVATDMADQQIASANGWTVVMAPNEPLSQKFNALTESLQQDDPDLTMLIGSDDLIEAAIPLYWIKTVDPKALICAGLQDLYVFSTSHRQCMYYPGYPEAARGSDASARKTIGAGRAFTRAVLQRMHWRPWGLHKMPRGLDTISSIEMRSRRIGEYAVVMRTTGGILADIKHSGNLTDFRFLTARGQDTPIIPLMAAFPEAMKEILELPFTAPMEVHIRKRPINPNLLPG